VIFASRARINSADHKIGSQRQDGPTAVRTRAGFRKITKTPATDRFALFHARRFPKINKTAVTNRLAPANGYQPHTLRLNDARIISAQRKIDSRRPARRHMARHRGRSMGRSHVGCFSSMWTFER
jgi:hypothetical protein